MFTEFSVYNFTIIYGWLFSLAAGSISFLESFHNDIEDKNLASWMLIIWGEKILRRIFFSESTVSSKEEFLKNTLSSFEFGFPLFLIYIMFCIIF